MNEKMTDRLTDEKAMGFITQLEDVFSSLPKLPQGLIDFLVKVAPYLALLSGILGLLSGPVVGILGTFSSVLGLNPVWMIATIVTVVLAIATAILSLMAYSPLKNRQLKGWIYLFWAGVLGVVISIVDILTGSSSILSIVFEVIWIYILFQMKPSYNVVAQVAQAAKGKDAV